jgi:hypothetical protein
MIFWRAAVALWESKWKEGAVFAFPLLQKNVKIRLT